VSGEIRIGRSIASYNSMVAIHCEEISSRRNVPLIL
jgi:hypothetical protein